MVRIATVDDAEQLEILNIEFNGKGETTLENIRESLLYNSREIVIVDEANGVLTGFLCIQMKKSFCYTDLMPEITEVYVRQEYRGRGIAGTMISFAEEYCRDRQPLHKFELLTGRNNTTAQAVYRRLGYNPDGEVHMVKRLKEL